MHLEKTLTFIFPFSIIIFSLSLSLSSYLWGWESREGWGENVAPRKDFRFHFPFRYHHKFHSHFQYNHISKVEKAERVEETTMYLEKTLARNQFAVQVDVVLRICICIRKHICICICICVHCKNILLNQRNDCHLNLWVLKQSVLTIKISGSGTRSFKAWGRPGGGRQGRAKAGKATGVQRRENFSKKHKQSIEKQQVYIN